MMGRVTEIVSDILGVDHVDPLTPLSEYGADSLDLLEISMAIEDEFRIAPLADFTTLDDIVREITRSPKP